MGGLNLGSDANLIGFSRNALRCVANEQTGVVYIFG